MTYVFHTQKHYVTNTLWFFLSFISHQRRLVQIIHKKKHWIPIFNFKNLSYDFWQKVAKRYLIFFPQRVPLFGSDRERKRTPANFYNGYLGGQHWLPWHWLPCITTLATSRFANPLKLCLNTRIFCFLPYVLWPASTCFYKANWFGTNKI